VVTAIRASGSVTLTHNERSFTDLPTAFACTAEAQFCQNNDVIHCLLARVVFVGFDRPHSLLGRPRKRRGCNITAGAVA